MSTTQAQIEEAEHLIAQKLAADRKRPDLRLVERSEISQEGRAYWREVNSAPPLSLEERRQQEQQERARKILEQAGGFRVPKRYLAYTLDTLRTLCSPGEYEDKRYAVLTMIDWAEGQLEKPGVLLWGKPGTGKTALALCALRYRAQRTGETKHLIRYIRFVKAIQANYDNGYNGPKQYQLMRAVQIAELLLVDDFGENAMALKDSASNDKQNIIREILDYRNMNDLPTVIISNLDQLRLMAQFGEDIISRLQEHCLLVEMGGVDLRKKGAKGW